MCNPFCFRAILSQRLAVRKAWAHTTLSCISIRSEKYIFVLFSKDEGLSLIMVDEKNTITLFLSLFWICMVYSPKDLAIEQIYFFFPCWILWLESSKAHIITWHASQYLWSYLIKNKSYVSHISNESTADSAPEIQKS